MKKICPECGTEYFGRKDKKYCSDQCRNSFNNRKGGQTNTLINQINRILRKNRLILSALNPDGKVKVRKSKLAEKGYQFQYHTNTYTTRAGRIYYFCYDHGYIELENDWLTLVVKQEYID